eukprot:TRINITY_DN1545_c0_g1_i4.p1 TRINITY_DN1545_c0_g1~~TRINITY_DN1545_c0_g1_i4.p1  ORF type:complete len:108 (-),score=21.20 TRINITY_DN1545_c0_g1_i4:283-606(-)
MVGLGLRLRAANKMGLKRVVEHCLKQWYQRRVREKENMSVKNPCGERYRDTNFSDLNKESSLSLAGNFVKPTNKDGRSQEQLSGNQHSNRQFCPKENFLSSICQVAF